MACESRQAPDLPGPGQQRLHVLLVLRQQLRIGRVLRRISIGAVLSRRRNVELVAGTGDAVLLKVILKEKDAQFRLAGSSGARSGGNL